MAINKKLIHFNNFSNFNSKKLSANSENTLYTLGIGGTVLTGNPEILYQSIVYIKDTQQQWTHGLLYNTGGSSEANVLAVDIIGELDELEVPIILIEPTEESIILYDKLIVIITNPTHYIDVEFADGINAHAKYTLLFQTDDSLGTLLLPEEVQWVNGEIPTLEANCNYELSVVKTSYNESNLIYKAIITKFTSL